VGIIPYFEHKSREKCGFCSPQGTPYLTLAGTGEHAESFDGINGIGDLEGGNGIDRENHISI